MKYTLSNTINSTLSKVAEKISDADGAKHWTEGLQSTEQISGKYCDVGSQRQMRFLHNGKEMMMTETIVEHRLPHQIKFAYDSDMSRNIVELVFEEISPNQVKQICNTELQLKGMMKYIGFLFTKMFKTQSLKFMDGFKEFVEE